MRRILLLVNPVFERHQFRRLPIILRAFEQAGVSVSVTETLAGRGAGAQARQAAAQGVDAVVVCGGDGTVFDALQGMAGSPVPLGIIPFGTGNVLAQNLGIPGDPAAAARWLLAARPVFVPLGRLTYTQHDVQQSWYFVMAAGMGVHAALMAAALRSKKNVGGRAAYFLAGLQLLLNHPLEPFELEITMATGEVHERRVCEAIAVRVAELNIWRPGGGLHLPFLRLASVEVAEGRGTRWQLGRATFEGLFLSAGSRHRPARRHAPARYEDVLRVCCRPIAGFSYSTPLAIQADGEVLPGSCARIEMAGVNVQLLAAEAPPHTRST